MTSELRSTVSVRLAVEVDARDIVRVYNQGICERKATVETEPRTEEQIAAALRERSDRYPTVVATIDASVVAVAWCSQYRSRECYGGIAEFSIYTDRAFRSRGLGFAVLTALAEEAESRGFWKLVARVFPENTASLALLERCGFRQVGLYKRHGRLDGAWRDCVIVERLLGDALLGFCQSPSQA